MKMKFPLVGLALVCCLLAACDKDDDNNSGNSALDQVFEDNTYQLTGVAIDSASSKLFVNYPRWSGPYRYGVVTVTADNNVLPFPDEATNMWLGGQDGETKWVCVQSVYFDDAGNLWILDPAAPNMGAVYQKSYKLVRVNKNTGAWEKKYEFDAVASDSSYLNDVRIDVPRQFTYITNSKEGGIVVVNLATSQMRQVLQDHYSVHSDTSFKFIIDGRELMRKGMPVKINSDGIALTPDGEWLYYKPLTDDKLYRIRTEYLRDFSMTSAELGSRVEDLGHKVTSDGMIFDNAGRLYLGDFTELPYSTDRSGG